MKKNVFCLCVLCLCILSNTVFAANWVYVGRGSFADGSNSYDAYVDKDSVEVKGDHVIFWEKAVLDKESGKPRAKTCCWQKEAITSNPRQIREIYCSAYDANGNKTMHSNTPTEFKPVNSPLDNQLIDAALKCAR